MFLYCITQMNRNVLTRGNSKIVQHSKVSNHCNQYVESICHSTWLWHSHCTSNKVVDFSCNGEFIQVITNILPSKQPYTSSRSPAGAETQAMQCPLRKLEVLNASRKLAVNSFPRDSQRVSVWSSSCVSSLPISSNRTLKGRVFKARLLIWL